METSRGGFKLFYRRFLAKCRKSLVWLVFILVLPLAVKLADYFVGDWVVNITKNWMREHHMNIVSSILSLVVIHYLSACFILTCLVVAVCALFSMNVQSPSALNAPHVDVTYDLPQTISRLWAGTSDLTR